jgi:voltage-gated potassium channel Kch
LWRIIAGLRTNDGKLLDFVSLGFLLTPVIITLLSNASEFSFGAEGVSWKRSVTTKLESADASLQTLNALVERLQAITTQGVGKRRRSLPADARSLAYDALFREALRASRTTGVPFGKSLLTERDTGPASEEPTMQEPASSPSAHPDDPQKGRWGGASERNYRRISATVTVLDDDPEMFEVALIVTSTDPGTHPLSGSVRFHLHDTFDPDAVRSSVRNGVARLVRYAWVHSRSGLKRTRARRHSSSTFRHFAMRRRPFARARRRDRRKIISVSPHGSKLDANRQHLRRAGFDSPRGEQGVVCS